MTHATTSALSGEVFYSTTRSSQRNPWSYWGLFGAPQGVAWGMAEAWTASTTYGWLDRSWRGLR